MKNFFVILFIIIFVDLSWGNDKNPVRDFYILGLNSYLSNDYNEAEKQFNNIISIPGISSSSFNEYLPKAYYHLLLINLRVTNRSKIEEYSKKILKDYKDTQYYSMTVNLYGDYCLSIGRTNLAINIYENYILANKIPNLYQNIILFKIAELHLIASNYISVTNYLSRIDIKDKYSSFADSIKYTNQIAIDELNRIFRKEQNKVVQLNNYSNEVIRLNLIISNDIIIKNTQLSNLYFLSNRINFLDYTTRLIKIKDRLEEIREERMKLLLSKIKSREKINEVQKIFPD